MQVGRIRQKKPTLKQNRVGTKHLGNMSLTFYLGKFERTFQAGIKVDYCPNIPLCQERAMGDGFAPVRFFASPPPPLNYLSVFFMNEEATDLLKENRQPQGDGLND